MPNLPQPVVFAFFDESVSKSLDIASLTAVLVPAEQYVRVRDSVLRIGFEVQRPPPNTIPRPMELHASEMLKDLDGASDDDRISVFEQIVNIVNEEQLPIVSVGYTNWSELEALREGDDKLHSLNFLGILSGLQPVLAEALVVPIVDGLPGGVLRNRKSQVEPQIFRAFITSVHFNQHMRAGDRVMDENMSIAHFRNIAEPALSDSAHSALLQLADVVSYLLMIQDAAEREAPTGFKARLAAVIEKLDKSLLRKWRGRMNFTTHV